MCGIAGILNSVPSDPPDEGILRRMLGTIRHRGPDEFGLYLGDDVGLGSARLSIVDLAGGQQPISNEDGTLWIVFNGEIFNYVELRAELEGRGHRFATHTDTEVIVHLFEDFGVEAFSRLNGQWALALWDSRRRQLVLSRDRLGVRPLFYAHSPEQLVFGSEIKAVLTAPGLSSEIEPASLAEVFTYWSALGDRTFFQGVHQLKPGHYLIASAGGVVSKPYWRLSFPLDRHSMGQSCAGLGNDGEESFLPELAVPEDEQQCADALRELLLDATRIRLRADVPVGAYLSGGLDSSIIATMVRRLEVARLDTFSIAFKDQHFDESKYQIQMSRALGTNHQVAYVTDSDIGNVFPDVVWHAETPLMRTAPAPMFLLSRLVHKCGYKVVLTGEGADEFLAGYDIFKEMRIRRFWARQPQSAIRALLLRRLYPDVQGVGKTGDNYLRAFFGRGLEDTSRADYSHAIRWANNRRCTRFLSADRQGAKHLGQVEPSDLVPPPGFDSWGPLERAQFWEISVFLSGYLLSAQGDRVAMANSVEGRFPFLDHRVVEFCCRLPARLKMRGLTEKYVLRKAFQQWLPPEIAVRPKRPYRAPIRRCFLGVTAPDYVAELLSESALRRSGLFNVRAVRQLVTKLEDGQTSGETDEMALVGILSTQLIQAEFLRRVRLVEPIGDGARVKVIDQSSQVRVAGSTSQT